MPKVPEEQTPTFSTNVPGVQFPFRQEFGKQGQALERIGEQTENAGDTFSAIQNRIRTAQNLSDASDAATQSKLSIDAQRQKLNDNSPDGYMYDPHTLDNNGHPTAVFNPDGTRQTTTDALKSWVDDHYTGVQDGLGDNDAKAMYREKIKPYFADSLIMQQHDVQTARVKATDQSYQGQVTEIQNSLVSNPDLDKLYGHAQDLKIQMTQYQNAGVHTGPEAEEIGKKADAALAESTVKGGWSQEILNNKKQPGAQTAAVNKWVSLLNGTDPQSMDRKSKGLPTLSDMMNPQQKALELDSLERYRITAKKSDLSNWDHWYDNQVAGMKTGRVSPDSVMPQIIAGLHGQVSGGDRQAGDAGTKFSAAAAAAAIGKATKSTRAQSPEAMQATAIMAANEIAKSSHEFAKSVGFPANAAGEPERNEAMTHLSTLINEEISSREKDVASYIGKADKDNFRAISPSMARFSQMDANRPVLLGQNAKVAQGAFRDVDVQARAMHLPADKVNYIPNEDSGNPMNAGTLSHQLKDPQINEGQAWNNFKAIKTMGGRWTPQIINQMIAQDKLGAEWGLMANVGTNVDPRTGAKMIAALRTPNTTMDQLIQPALATNNEKLDDFNGAVAKKVSDWAEGQVSANPFSLGTHNFQAAAQKGIGNLAKMYYAADPSLGKDAAIDKAYATFIGDNTHTMRNGPAGLLWGMHENGVVNIPKQLHDGAPVTDQEAVNAIHFMSQAMTPEGIRKINPAVPAGADESQRAHFSEYVAARDPRATFFYNNGVPSMGITYQGKRDREYLMMDPKGVVPYSVPLNVAKQPPATPIKPIHKITPSEFFGSQRTPD